MSVMSRLQTLQHYNVVNTGPQHYNVTNTWPQPRRNIVSLYFIYVTTTATTLFLSEITKI